MRVLILYTRLTGYWMACLRHSRDHFGMEFLVFRYKPSLEAPFDIYSEEGIQIEEIENFEEKKFFHTVEDYNPQLIYVSGWTNNLYLALAKKYKKQGISVITGMDNHWQATPKQYLAICLSRWFVHPFFSHIWIPGSAQYPFAQKLGFKAPQIKKGLYCADESLFRPDEMAKPTIDIVFVGRLVAHKGINELIEVLDQLIATNSLDLRIHFIGNGPLSSKIPQHPYIKHTPFVKPDKLPRLLNDAKFLILPSNYEAWGLVVHEALLCGLPVISTYQCGAASDFIEDDVNGFLFNARDTQELKLIFQKISKLNNDDYQILSKNALIASAKLSVSNWSTTLNSFVR
jgi:glycosyltransferase involved in cell wall biosynthesis